MNFVKYTPSTFYSPYYNVIIAFANGEPQPNFVLRVLFHVSGDPVPSMREKRVSRRAPRNSVKDSDKLLLFIMIIVFPDSVLALQSTGKLPCRFLGSVWDK